MGAGTAVREVAREGTNHEDADRADRQTGEVVQAPRLRGTLKLRNATLDQTARLISGSLETSRDFDVSFPAAALDGQRLSDIRAEVTYIPGAYRAESVTVPVSLAP